MDGQYPKHVDRDVDPDLTHQRLQKAEFKSETEEFQMVAENQTLKTNY